MRSWIFYLGVLFTLSKTFAHSRNRCCDLLSWVWSPILKRLHGMHCFIFQSCMYVVNNSPMYAMIVCVCMYQDEHSRNVKLSKSCFAACMRFLKIDIYFKSIMFQRICVQLLLLQGRLLGLVFSHQDREKPILWVSGLCER